MVVVSAMYESTYLSLDFHVPAWLACFRFNLPNLLSARLLALEPVGAEKCGSRYFWGSIFPSPKMNDPFIVGTEKEPTSDFANSLNAELALSKSNVPLAVHY
jgi:hypothetical protein